MDTVRTIDLEVACNQGIYSTNIALKTQAVEHGL